MIQQILQVLYEPEETIKGNDLVSHGGDDKYDLAEVPNAYNVPEQELLASQGKKLKFRKFERVQHILDDFIQKHSKETFVFPEIREATLSQKEQFFSFIFEVLREGKIAETEILQEENAENNQALEGKSRGFWSFFERRASSRVSHEKEEEGEIYDDPELFANLTVLKLSCLKILRLLSRDKVIYEGELGSKILSEENLMVLVRMLKENPISLDAVISPPNSGPTKNGRKDSKKTTPERRKSSTMLNDYHPAVIPDKPIASMPEEEKMQILETQKCLCNFVYNEPRVRQTLSSSLVPQIIMFRDPDRYWKVPNNKELVFFDLRLLFLLTAFDVDLRSRLMGYGDDSFKDYTLPHFTDMLHHFAKLNSDGSSPDKPTLRTLTDPDVEIANEILKVLFNLTMVLKKKPGRRNSLPTPDQPEQIKKLVETCRLLLLIDSRNNSKQQMLTDGDMAKKIDIDSNVVNLLTNIPPEYYVQLVTACNAGQSTDNESKTSSTLPDNLFTVVTFYEENGLTHENTSSQKNSPYIVESAETFDISAIKEVLRFLTSRFDSLDTSMAPETSQTSPPNPKKSQLEKETLVPCLLFLSEAAKGNRVIRKYLKSLILPKLSIEELKQLPEQGSKLRNRLCKLMTSPMLDLKELSAELLFTLCKENVKKMVKYTGYGNAAGILARLGLMSGGSGPNRQNFSSDSSETENDQEVNKNINPITGQWESDEVMYQREQSLNNLTEDEKLARAEEISKLLRDLKATGIINPVAIGKDGRPIPFEFDETSGP